MVTRHRLLALLAACACASLLHERDYTSFDRLCISLAGQEAASGGQVVMPLPDVTRLAGQLVAIVLHLSASGPVPRVARIAIGETVLAPFTLVPGEAVRIDRSLPDAARLAAGDSLQITSEGEDGALDRPAVTSYLPLPLPAFGA